MLTELLGAILIQLAFFLPAYLLQTDKFTDLSYGLTFIILAGAALSSSDLHPLKALLFFLILLWATRLVLYLVIRIKRMGRDDRFDSIRSSALRFGLFWLLQGVAAWAILLPAFLFFKRYDPGLNLVSALGPVLWLAGFGIEAVADQQKYAFKSRPANRNKWIASGLWAYSRHPNYLGEILCWTGIYLFTMPSLPFTQALLGLASPLLITYLLLYATGIPRLEAAADQRWGKLKAYQEYKRKTGLLLPRLR